MRNKSLSVVVLWCLILAIAWLGIGQIARANSTSVPATVSLDWSVVTSDPSSSLYGTAIALDSTENVLVAGSIPRMSMVTAKYNRQGLLLWQRTFDNPGTREQATWIATDPFDNVWVIGNFVSTSSPYPSGFITLKYDANGNLLWQDLQPLIHGGAVRIVTDQYGNAYFTGRAWYSSATDDIVTIKYAPDGTRLWERSESFDAFSQDGPQALVLAPNGNVVVAGAAGGYFMTYVYAPNGDLVWYRNYQGSSGAHDVAVNAANEVYVVGSTYMPPAGNRELVLKYDASGTLVWANDYTGYSASKIALDASGNLFVTGYEANFYTDWWTMKINSAGTMLWGQSYNQTTSFDEYPTTIRVGSDGAAYVAGQGGPGQQYYMNVVVKYTIDGAQEWAVQTDTSLRAVGLQLGSDLSVFVIGESPMTTYHYVQDIPTPGPTNTATNTSVPPSVTATGAPSSATPVPSSATLTPTPTNTPVAPQPTNTPVQTATAPVQTTDTPAPVPTTATPCPIQFDDVLPGSTFYAYIRCLACLGIVNGYADHTFRPNTNITRGQISKIVSNAAAFSDPQPDPMFEDVSVGSTFQVYIGRLASRGYINGYPCGGVGEPCVAPGNLPYFRPNDNATRGQIAKIDANAAGFVDPPVGQSFEDVAPGGAFYTYTQRLASRSIMAGYPCGGAGEPCIPSDNRPYFRPNNNATRGQTSKIVSGTFFPNCQTPGGSDE